MNSNVLAWLRAFLSAAFGGAADGILVGTGGASVVSATTNTTVNLHLIAYLVGFNVLQDTARFVKQNSDPWGFTVPAAAAPETIRPLAQPHDPSA